MMSLVAIGKRDIFNFISHPGKKDAGASGGEFRIIGVGTDYNYSFLLV
ncbi:hypothetical protein SDC9_165525 [bioreactor metagenome]|uniref:Uncharacterized protein n=1 Tax=bioreactor metagenome TaxID=1076179 RepID=A0A645FUI7_9ZZZZ